MDDPRLYREFADWWPLMSAPADYEEEARFYLEVIDANARGPVSTMLELGSGGGNNASHLKARFAMTLVDRSPGMLEQSRALNPDCEHVEGDMRAVRLDRMFDVVFVHDAIMYMTTLDDLRAVFATAFAHCTTGGLALFVPDDTAETYRSETHAGGHDGENRSMRYLQWSHEPRGTTALTSFVYVFREGDGPVRVEYDEHEFGIFGREVWLREIAATGFEARSVPDTHSLSGDTSREMFIGLKR